MSIFSKECINYLKKGYSVIPDHGKKPLIKGWTKYNNVQPKESDIKEWCESFKEANISIVLGKQSGVIALDMDEINPDIVKLLEPLPDSPVERIGAKGYVRFFQYSGEPTQNLYIIDPITNKKRIVLELLSSGKKVTIAPSIHPITKKPYRWTNKALLDVDIKELPKFPPMLITNLQQKLKMFESSYYGGNEVKITEGRNIALTSEVARLISNPHTINDIINKLIKFDEDNHDKPLFSDNGETDFKNKYYNALNFYNNNLKSINNKRLREGKGLELPIFNNNVSVLNNLIKKDNQLPTSELPAPYGKLKLIYDHILNCSYVEQPTFALSAGLILLGVLASRKFTFQGSTPNLYLLNIADSGSGKDSCQQVIKNLLHEIGAGNKLLGATSYPSEASITQSLDVSPVRLDVIDECSTFLSAATRGGASYASGIGDTLCELYSCSNSYYLGKALASQERKIGAVHRPHLNILGSTTYRGISDSISTISLEKGLFCRFMLAFGDNNKRGKRIVKISKPPEELLLFLKYLYEFITPNIKVGNFNKFNAPAYKVSCTRTANDLLNKYHAIFDDMRVNSKDSISRPIISRLFQHMMKIVLISSIGNTELGKLPLVKPLDVEFAYKYVLHFYDNVINFVKDNLYESQRDMKVNKVLKTIRSAGDEGLSNVDLALKCKYLSTSERMEIIKDLKESNRIMIKNDENTNDNIMYRFYYLQ